MHVPLLPSPYKDNSSVPCLHKGRRREACHLRAKSDVRQRQSTFEKFGILKNQCYTFPEHPDAPPPWHRRPTPLPSPLFIACTMTGRTKRPEKTQEGTPNIPRSLPSMRFHTMVWKNQTSTRIGTRL